MLDWRSRAHVRWECKYHVVIIPKCWRKVTGGCGVGLDRFCGSCASSEAWSLIEGKAMADHVAEGPSLRERPPSRGLPKTHALWAWSISFRGRGGSVDAVTPHVFITKWRASALKERSVSQEHFIDLCHLLGRGRPHARVAETATGYV